MEYVHQQLKILQGESDPLYSVAKIFRARASVLCFDEFYVSDIADAMILSKLFRHLFSMGVTLVATSNTKPEDLYPNGLQREKFLPTITLLHRYTKVISVQGSTDYRMQYLANASLYHCPADENAERYLMNHFQCLAFPEGISGKTITIMDRAIPTKWWADNVVWFDFSTLCVGSRSALDYIQIARDYETVLVSNVQRLGEQNEDVARRFIALVDEFYDHKVTLILSASEPLATLYQGKRYARDFQRTLSRLTEMQSIDYLQKHHIP
jgi:cell division protein ZapE